MNLKKLTAVLLTITILFTTLISCGTSKPAPIKLIPKTSNLVAHIYLSRLLNDTELVSAYDNATKGTDNPQTVQEALDELSDKTGINLHDFSDILLFGDISQMQESDPGYFAIITQGTFNEKQFVQNIENRSGEKLNANDYKGYQVYTSGEDSFSFVFLGNSTLIFGTSQAVEDCIDINKGDQQPLSGPIIDSYERLGDTAIKVAFAIPAETRNEMEQGITDDLPIQMDAFSKIDLVGIAIDKKSQDLTFKIDIHFLDSNSAQAAKDALSGTVTLLKGVAPSNEIKNLLGKVEFTTSDLWMTISLKTTLVEVGSFADSLTKD